tara:strand:+ start:2490 stop:3074 length:585 start_codon:yes stop_codon:yes gene_type:complete
MFNSGLFSFLKSAEVKKTKSIFRAWVTQIYQYKETYKHFPPVLLQNQEGDPLEIGQNFQEVHDRFLAALKGREWDRTNNSWIPLDQYRDENKRSREFHSFGEDEFGENGFLVDAWGGDRIFIVVDRDGDGLIELEATAFTNLKDALIREYDSQIVENAGDKLKFIHEKVGIYILNDGGDSLNVFSWNIEKYLEE